MAIETNATPSGTRIEYRKFVCAVGETNHNKYWNVGLYDSDDVEIHFGRIGVTESQGVHRGVCRDFMEKKIREKEKGKMNKKTGEREPYTEINTIETNGSSNITNNGSDKNLNKSTLRTIAKDQIEHSSPITAKLLDWLADVNRHTITGISGGQITLNDTTGLYETPLGIVTPASISLARALLVKIADNVVKDEFHYKTFKRAVDEYLTLIPHNLGMKWSPEGVFSDIQAVQRENGILDALDASYITATTQTDDVEEVQVETPKIFETKLIDVDNKKTMERIKRKFEQTKNSMHRQVYSMKIEKVWEVDVKPMTEVFSKTAQKVGNVMTLWHGTQAANLLSILKVGLVIPPSSSSHCTGRMFGDGVYASDQSTKALNYATSFWGGKDVGRYFMFLVDFAMGKPYYPDGYGCCVPDLSKYDSTYAKAGSGGVRNNEMIVYKTCQACLKFLVEFRNQ
jgi:poly [ADP-ribose] polymerase